MIWGSRSFHCVLRFSVTRSFSCDFHDQDEYTAEIFRPAVSFLKNWMELEYEKCAITLYLLPLAALPYLNQESSLAPLIGWEARPASAAETRC